MNKSTEKELNMKISNINFREIIPRMYISEYGRTDGYRFKYSRSKYVACKMYVGNKKEKNKE